jgi:hypothetical protein
VAKEENLVPPDDEVAFTAALPPNRRIQCERVFTPTVKTPSWPRSVVKIDRKLLPTTARTIQQEETGNTTSH